MWCAEVKAKINIPLGEEIGSWSNKRLRDFINKNRNFNCNEFNKALDWLSNRDYKEVIKECPNKKWLDWLQQKLPCLEPIKQNSKITITYGNNEKYALWHYTGIYDLPEKYIGETIRIVSNTIDK